MLKSNKIYQGDCQMVIRDIDSDSVDCIVTDPPYGLSFMGKDWDKAVPSVEIWKACFRVLKPGAFAFIMCIPRQDCLAHMIVPKAAKSEKNRGLKDESNIHPTCKSIKLMSWLITFASREGDPILDPFCGSGTTAIAAKMLSRQYIGIEREEEYCEIARKRLSAIPQRLDSYNVF